MAENVDLQGVIDEKLIKPIKSLRLESYQNGDKLITFYLNKVLASNNKEEMLLQFRRSMEMLIQQHYIVTVSSKSTNKIIAVRQDNFLQLLDDRYYTELKMSSFLDLFKLETDNFKKLGIVESPHIKLVINYVETHYNTTFRKFMNRNLEYYYMYKFFFDYGEDIKYVLNLLNAYHYSENVEDNILYNVGFDEVKQKVIYIYERICELLENVHKIFST